MDPTVVPTAYRYARVRRSRVSPLRAVPRFVYVERAPAVGDRDAADQFAVSLQAIDGPVRVEAGAEAAGLVPGEDYLDTTTAGWELGLALLRDPPKGGALHGFGLNRKSPAGSRRSRASSSRRRVRMV
jgi:hypothetical protein